MSMKFDYKELQELQKRIEKSTTQSDEIIKRAVINIANRIMRGAIRGTPTGETKVLKQSWKVGNLKKTANGYEMEIYNNTPYAVFVEYGHRIVSKNVTVGWKEGVLMMTASENAVKKEVDKIVKKEVDKYLNEVFNG